MDTSPHFPNETSVHVRRVLEHDDASSWLWIVSHLSPFLELQARYRMRQSLRRVCDVGDLLNDVWLRAYPQLSRLVPRDGRFTPVLMRLLSVILLRRINELLRKEIRRGGALPLDGGGEPLGARCPAADSAASAGARMMRDETGERIRAALRSLSRKDAEVLVLRGIEQIPNQDAARILGLRPGTLAMRYKRALERLRHRLPRDLYDELLARSA